MAVNKRGRVSSGELPAGVVASIRADIARWTAGLWAEEVNLGPACQCGVRPAGYSAAGGGIPNGKCERHARVD